MVKDKVKNDIGMIIDSYNEEKKIIAIANELIGIKIEKPSLSIADESISSTIEKKFGEDYKYFSESKKEEIFKKISNPVKREINKKKPKFIKNPDMDEIIKKKVNIDYDIPYQCLEKLYHPSDIDIYPEAKPCKDGKKYLGSPMTPSVRNPMAMKALHQMKYLINTLIKDGSISCDDTINIEVARELNDANMRAAIKRYQNDNRKKHEEYAKEIIKLKYEPNDSNILKYQLYDEQKNIEKDILKYQLREEQKHICLYTGNQINIHDFLGSDPKFDIEHTIPRSQSFDDSQENLTLCDLDFNRNIKKNKIPQQLANIDEILPRMEHWAKEIDELNKQINKEKNASRMSGIKEDKDRHIQNKHYYTLKRNYIKNKYDRFLMSSVPEGFSNRQLVSTGVITRYALAYLKTVFDRAFIVKGKMTALFRKNWGLQDEFTSKERTSHAHHMIDAIVIASINRGYYNLLSQYYMDEESLGYKPKNLFKKPWETFTEDVKHYEEEIIAKHFSKDSTLKHTKKIVRVRGKVKEFADQNGNKTKRYMNGDSFRGSLHKETFYGAIKRKGDNEPVYVTRKPLDFFETNEKKLEDIVDETVKNKIINTVNERKSKGQSLKEALDVTNNPIWMNEDKKIQIKKVRIFTPDVKNPIFLKKHRDKSGNNKDYKENIYVDNEENNVFGIYQGTMGNKIKRIFKMINNFEISKGDTLPDEIDGMKRIYKLKKGAMVLLYENSPDEIYKIKDDYRQLSKRLYKLFKFDVNGQIYFIHHLEARPKGELKNDTKFVGVFKPEERIYAIRLFSPRQLNLLVENKDFKITNDGKIEFL